MSSPARPLPAQAPTADSARRLLERIAQGLATAIEGKPEQLKLALTCLAASGHLLIEDIPGVGKTTLAEAMALCCGLSFGRIQFTADLMPADVLGVQLFQARDATFQFRPGPIFHQLVLADELNRAPPRTQSALLEAMAQAQVTVDGQTHPLGRPFMVIATQNPLDLSGTYPLPDSQLDRFLVRLALGPPAPEVEARLLATRGATAPVQQLAAVTSPEELALLQQLAARVHVDESVAAYAVSLVAATREHPQLERGASTRAALALMAAAKAHALWDQRDFVIPEDVSALLIPALAHRLLVRSALTGSYSRDEAAQILGEIATRVPAPR